jgi:hypothetical protein
MTPLNPLFILFMAGVNALATLIVVESKFFELPRTKVRQIGKWLESQGAPAPDSGRLKRTIRWGCRYAGGMMAYFVGCPLCTGVWIGILQAVIWPGPLNAHLALMTVVANGLLYKMPGHVIYELLALLRNLNSLLSEGIEERRARASAWLKLADRLERPSDEPAAASRNGHVYVAVG